MGSGNLQAGKRKVWLTASGELRVSGRRWADGKAFGVTDDDDEARAAEPARFSCCFGVREWVHRAADVRLAISKFLLSMLLRPALCVPHRFGIFGCCTTCPKRCRDGSTVSFPTKIAHSEAKGSCHSRPTSASCAWKPEVLTLRLFLGVIAALVVSWPRPLLPHKGLERTSLLGHSASIQASLALQPIRNNPALPGAQPLAIRHIGRRLAFVFQSPGPAPDPFVARAPQTATTVADRRGSAWFRPRTRQRRWWFEAPGIRRIRLFVNPLVSRTSPIGSRSPTVREAHSAHPPRVSRVAQFRSLGPCGSP